MKYKITVATVIAIPELKYPDTNTVYEQFIETESSLVENVIKAVNGL